MGLKEVSFKIGKSPKSMKCIFNKSRDDFRKKSRMISKKYPQGVINSGIIDLIIYTNEESEEVALN